MSKRIPTIFLLALMAALVAWGCGSSGDDELTKAEFIKQADVVCRQGEKEKQEKMETALAKSSAGEEKPLKLKELQDIATGAILPPLRNIADELQELSAPGGEDGKAGSIVAEFDQTVSELEKNPLPLATGKSDPFESVAKEAEDYGFKACILYY